MLKAISERWEVLQMPRGDLEGGRLERDLSGSRHSGEA